MGASDKHLVAQLVTAINQHNADGWRCERKPRGKYVVYPPQPHKIFQISLTPSDHRWYANTVSRIRRAGWDASWSLTPKTQNASQQTEHR